MVASGQRSAPNLEISCFGTPVHLTTTSHLRLSSLAFVSIHATCQSQRLLRKSCRERKSRMKVGSVPRIVSVILCPTPSLFGQNGILIKSTGPNCKVMGRNQASRDGKPDPHNRNEPKKKPQLSERVYKLTGIPYIKAEA